jgi:hypothetical protein
MSKMRRFLIAVTMGLCGWGAGIGLYGQSGVYDRMALTGMPMACFPRPEGGWPQASLARERGICR